MIGRTHVLSRPRRSFRRYLWTLVVIFVFLLWQSTGITEDIYSDPEDASELLDSPTSPETIEANLGEESQLGVDINNPRNVHSKPALLVNAQPHHISLPSPPHEAPNTPAHNTRSTPGGVSIEHELEYQEVDDIEQIGGHRDDNGVDHAAELTHPDDDESAVSDGRDGAAPNDVDELQLTDRKDKKEDADNRLNAQQHQNSRGEQLPIGASDEKTPWSEQYDFPTWEQCQEMKEKADSLPDLIHVPFEVAVKDMVLEGWEDEWISKAHYVGPKLEEPKIDFVYTWVNGSQQELTETMRPYELNSTLNDPDGVWIASHGSNRYREWDELRYSMRSVQKFAGHFANRIQILVNAFRNPKTDELLPTTFGKQRPHWLRADLEKVEVLSQEEFFGPDERKCLPTFDSLTIENQLYNTKSEVDRLYALSDDMILGKPHSASDLYSPLFGPTMGFKTNSYNTLQPPTEKDAERFGEKPFLIYTSWLLNRRFGARKRKGQVHFGHSLSRSVAREAITSFPRPALRSAYQRFRGETGFQLYSWYVIFHYTMERHREALLWSYIMLRSDHDDDGYLDWSERQKILRELGEGMSNDTPELFRQRMYYQVASSLEQAGIQPPMVNNDILWTSLDGPAMIQGLDCDAFDVEDCLAPGFSLASSDAEARSPVFSTATIFDRVTRGSPRCGDCLIKLILNRRRAGLGPLLPHHQKKAEQRKIVIKALIRYQYLVVNPDAMFYMITDAEQAEHVLFNPYIKHNKKAGQICLNDDVVTSDKEQLERLRKVMSSFFEHLLPDASSYEK
ncbi:uncharacterized protein EI97DRAFT_403857 [Westerdykella ornata]|uniref:Stealth protein CR1 conserved region 1 domain-containing protein n=1 Tax=Westerdykella ornata TaxID=318751 RepID=A0A6A6JBA7_WESOR|nr:uncharacterized protein EI97DRAFT_403857 [Westerdykella ornata]KAF2273712.1 hypothetical protein EI97DRAFT_403857 [Westerdykella ornata]